jgi:hypothetical protein
MTDGASRETSACLLKALKEGHENQLLSANFPTPFVPILHCNLPLIECTTWQFCSRSLHPACKPPVPAAA